MNNNKSHIPFLGHLSQSDLLSSALNARPAAGQPLRVKGLTQGLKGMFAASLFGRRKRQCIVVAADADNARELWNDVTLMLSEGEVLFIGEKDSSRHHAIRSTENTFAENADALRSLNEEPLKLVITDADTLLTDYPSVEEIRGHSIHLRRDEDYGQEKLVRALALGGFEQREFVAGTGEYAVRGGIVDVFPVGLNNPLRIEFFGDEIDSIREFDALNQRSIRHHESFAFVCSLFLGGESENLHGESESAVSGMPEFFSDDCLLVIDGIESLHQRAEELDKRQLVEQLIATSPSWIISVLSDESRQIDIGGEAQPAFNASIRMLKETLVSFAERDYTTFLVADSDQQVERLEDLLHAPSDAEDDEDHFPLPVPRVHFCPISSGFVLPEIKLAVLAEHQIFNRKHVQRSARKGTKGISLREMRQLRIGDFVVHADKGIGRFAGFETITVAGGLQETAKLIYAGDDTLYVNLSAIGKLQKYSSEEGRTPVLSKLGSGAWERMKARTKKRLKDIARDLIQLYAKRKMSKGFSFSEDSQWQKELEASFIYEDTPDQATATGDVKRDMEDEVPMDRLVCGDVGYGKTEVAIRAAFKAVLDGKQVAILVPTTILAQQHYNTFRDRLHRYSVVVEALSRFRTRKEQTAILEKLSHGSVDVIIGTHRILSKDVNFKDLGLLIIDEEHRFGVTAKEKLRDLKKSVDTLTMTATPIPRTLNFSLLGARDLSIIETPPKNRLPIVTTIVPFQESIIVEGIERELERGGQVFFVHDKIKDIELLADKLRIFLPKARIGIAHGRMKGTELERIMMRFLEKKIDVLVATKIVESGLDIPNANTIFINRANHFGLAELYQLRGRVGRSNIQAYAYLMIPPETKFTRDALKRLQAIEEFSELGTGFQLSMRDLEIRGAGNLLGAEQSGFIAEIGFETFMSVLDEAVHELKKEEFEGLFKDEKPVGPRPRSDVAMELGLDAFFPQDYVRNATERFDLYKRLYNCDSGEGIEQIEIEIADRFGKLPPEAENLFTVVRTRLTAAIIRFSRVTLDKGNLNIALPPEDDELFYERHFQTLMQWVLSNKDRARLEQDHRQVRMIIRNVTSSGDVQVLLDKMLAVVTEMPAVVTS